MPDPPLYIDVFEKDVDSHDMSTQSAGTFCRTLQKADHGLPTPSDEVHDALYEEAVKYTTAVEAHAFYIPCVRGGSGSRVWNTLSL